MLPDASPEGAAIRRGESPRWRALSLESRLFAAFSAVGLAGLLAVARYLQPDPSGVGTHTQLGLPPTLVMDRFGVPCPLCGMTTSWAHATRADLGAAFWAQPAGTLFAFLAVGLIPVLFAAAYTGRYPAWVDAGPVRLWGLRAAIAVLAGGWMYKLAAVFFGS
jgi:hypothetical protein